MALLGAQNAICILGCKLQKQSLEPSKVLDRARARLEGAKCTRVSFSLAITAEL